MKITRYIKLFRFCFLFSLMFSVMIMAQDDVYSSNVYIFESTSVDGDNFIMKISRGNTYFDPMDEAFDLVSSGSLKKRAGGFFSLNKDNAFFGSNIKACCMIEDGRRIVEDKTDKQGMGFSVGMLFMDGGAHVQSTVRVGYNFGDFALSENNSFYMVDIESEVHFCEFVNTFDVSSSFISNPSKRVVLSGVFRAPKGGKYKDLLYIFVIKRL